MRIFCYFVCLCIMTLFRYLLLDFLVQVQILCYLFYLLTFDTMLVLELYLSTCYRVSKFNKIKKRELKSTENCQNKLTKLQTLT